MSRLPDFGTRSRFVRAEIVRLRDRHGMPFRLIAVRLAERGVRVTAGMCLRVYKRSLLPAAVEVQGELFSEGEGRE